MTTKPALGRFISSWCVPGLIVCICIYHTKAVELLINPVHVCTGDDADLIWTPTETLGEEESIQINKVAQKIDKFKEDPLFKKSRNKTDFIQNGTEPIGRTGIRIFDVGVNDSGIYGIRWFSRRDGHLNKEVNLTVHEIAECPNKSRYFSPTIRVSHATESSRNYTITKNNTSYYVDEESEVIITIPPSTILMNVTISINNETYKFRNNMEMEANFTLIGRGTPVQPGFNLVNITFSHAIRGVFEISINIEIKESVPLHDIHLYNILWIIVPITITIALLIFIWARMRRRTNDNRNNLATAKLHTISLQDIKLENDAAEDPLLSPPQAVPPRVSDSDTDGGPLRSNLGVKEFSIEEFDLIDIIKHYDVWEKALMSLKESSNDKFVRTTYIGSGELYNPLRDIASQISAIDHPNIIKLFGIIEQPYSIIHRHLPCAIEGVNIVNLYDLLSAQRDNKIQQHNQWDMMKNVTFDIVSGLAYLHSKHIAHRNLAPYNILLQRQDEDSIVALINDLTHIHVVPIPEYNNRDNVFTMKSNYGVVSLPYQAPEMIGGSNKLFNISELLKADVWSFGSVIYSIISPKGQHPFETEYKEEQLKLSNFLYSKYKNEELPKIVTGHLPDDDYYNKLCFVLELCWQFKERYRPHMSSIESQLTGNITLAKEVEPVALKLTRSTKKKKFLEIYFSNEADSGAGTFEEIFYDQNLGSAVITFHDHETCARVAAKDHIEQLVIGHTLTVLRPCPVGDLGTNRKCSSICIHEVPRGFDQDELVQFIQKCTVSRCHIATRTDGIVLVKMDYATDVHLLAYYMHLTPFHGGMLAIHVQSEYPFRGNGTIPEKLNRSLSKKTKVKQIYNRFLFRLTAIKDVEAMNQILNDTGSNEIELYYDCDWKPNTCKD